MWWTNTLRTSAEDLGTLSENEPPTDALREDQGRMTKIQELADRRQTDTKTNRSWPICGSQENPPWLVAEEDRAFKVDLRIEKNSQDAV